MTTLGWIIGGGILLVILLFVLGCCRVADKYDRDTGMK